MKNFLLLLSTVLCVIFGYLYFKNKATSQEDTTAVVLEKQLQQVGKLVVVEGHFSKVHQYKQYQEYLGSYVSFEKKALAVVNAKVTVSYDLQELVYQVLPQTKQLVLLKIPQRVLNIYPDITFYDVDQSIFNPFTATDYNAIKIKLKQELQTMVETSSMVQNAESHFLSELSKIYMLTSTMGWELVYQDKPITSASILDKKLLKP